MLLRSGLELFSAYICPFVRLLFSRCAMHQDGSQKPSTGMTAPLTPANSSTALYASKERSKILPGRESQCIKLQVLSDSGRSPQGWWMWRTLKCVLPVTIMMTSVWPKISCTISCCGDGQISLEINTSIFTHGGHFTNHTVY